MDARKSNRLQPAVAESFTGDDEGTSFQQQVVVGASYTTEFNISTNYEYHYNQAGMSDKNWDSWFKAGKSASGDIASYGQLLSIRGLAQNRVEPLSKHSLFIRSQWDDAILDNLNLTLQLMLDLVDHSSMVQAEASYDINSRASLSLRLVDFNGSDESNYGSLTHDMTTTLQFNYDFK